jgi:hypothetical protein
MPACEVTRNHTIHFFRKGVGQIARSEAAFDMAERNASIEGGECRHHDGRRIPLPEHHIRIFAGERVIQCDHQASSQFGQRLVLAHDIQITISLDIEHLKDLIEHFPMLGSRKHSDSYPWLATASQNDWGHLDGLRTCPNHEKNSLNDVIGGVRRPPSRSRETVFQQRILLPVFGLIHHPQMKS